MGIKYLGLLLVFLLPVLISGASAAIYVENASVLNFSLNTSPVGLNSSLNSVHPRIFTEDVDSLLGQTLNTTPSTLNSSLNVVRPRIFTEQLDATLRNNLINTPNALNISLTQVRPRIFTENLDSYLKDYLFLTPNTLDVSIASVRPRIFTENLDSIYLSQLNAPPFVTPSTLIVIAPNGGENWARSTTQTIRWNYTGSPGSFVNITLLKGGVFNRTINSSIPVGSSGSGSYNWLINSTQTLGSDYKVMVTSTTNSAYTDTSDNNFTISAPAISSITVTSPNGGETWARGVTQTIKWTYVGNPGSSVKIELMKGGVLNSTINSSTSIGINGSGSYNWLINSTQTLGSDYKVMVTSTTNSAYTDTSDNNFTISAPAISSITVTSPNGGETWARGVTQTIKWTYVGNPGSSVKIELMKGGVLNSTINSSTSIGINGSGSYNWLINSTQTMGTDYMVRVTSTTNPVYNDSSNANFNISAPPLVCNTSTIYGYSFNDSNANKTKEPGEGGLSNWTINLNGYDTCGGTLVSKTIQTNSTGYFAFTGIDPGVYVLSQNFAIGWLPTTDAAYTLTVPSISTSLRKDFGNRKFVK